LLVGLVALVVLAPWWRNHRYLRDLYDYGLVMAGVGRMAAGEHPYVDFVTPIQTGLFLLNGWAERLGGGTFQGMTRGTPVLAVLAVGLLAGLLARRWPWWAALSLAGAVASMAVVQHSIIWHNSLGVVCIAVAALASALAPTLRREQWGLHLLTAAALFLGGITKLNSHLVALACVLAWALHSGFTGPARWSAVFGTVLLAGFCGVVLPVGFELWLTGAPLETWWYNVVTLPLASRTGILGDALEWRFYFTTRHDYYGALALPQLGAVGVLVTGLFAVAGIRAAGPRRAGWILGAALLAAASGAALLATNQEIAYVALGAWFALIAALWVGFGLRPGGVLFTAGLIGPALVIGGLAWHSAWQGQRSQFGHSAVSRSTYLEAGTAAPEYAYLRGTLLPPVIVSSLADLAGWLVRHAVGPQAPVFYGPGLEALERIWPVRKVPGLPLWMHGGTSYGAREDAALQQALSAEGVYQHVVVPESWNHWTVQAGAELDQRYVRDRLGPVWYLYEKLPSGVVSWRALEFLRAFGGNVDPGRLISQTMERHALADGRKFLGVTRGAGELQLVAPSYRAQGEAVLRRRPDAPGRTGNVRFSVFAVAGENQFQRWLADVTLPEDADEVLVPFGVDASGLPMRLEVQIPPELDGAVSAGWRGLSVMHAVDGPESPPRVQQSASEAFLANDPMRLALLPAGWNPDKVFVREGRTGPQGLEIAPGGEVWIRLTGGFTEINGVVTVAAADPMPVQPLIRVLYYKGARLDVLTQGPVRAEDRRFEFKAWSTEPGGWLVILTEPGQAFSPVSVRINSVKPAD
jgi:hypothetical protein